MLLLLGAPPSPAQVIWSGDYNGVAGALIMTNQPEIWSGVRPCVFKAGKREKLVHPYLKSY